MKIIYQLNKIIKQDFPKARVFLVGGTLRDKLLNQEPKDFDLVVQGVSEKKLRHLLKKHGKTKLVGKKFGIFKWQAKNSTKIIDIALPRTEIAKKTGKRKDFIIKTDYQLPIKKDLARRDFTINAIAFNLNTKKYIDPFYGRKDLKHKIIKTVGNPEKRFKEDYSRILRAIRLSCQLNFKININTWQAIKKQAHKTNAITKEIAAKEIIKALMANPERAAALFEKARIWKALIPEIEKLKNCTQPKKWHKEGDVWQHTLLALKKLEKIKNINPDLILSVLLHDIGKPATKKNINYKISFKGHAQLGAKIAEKIIKRTKLESAGINKNNVIWLIKNHMILINADVKKMRASTIAKYFLSNQYPSSDLLKLITCDDYASRPSKSRVKPSKLEIAKKRIIKIKKNPQKPLLNGNQIIKILNLKPGPKLGKIIQKLKSAQLAGRITSFSQAKKFIKKNK